jgi:arsenate reductase (thioredoxin)
MALLTNIEATIKALPVDDISQDRKELLQLLIDYVQGKKNEGVVPRLNFICTHNSRRSQLSQVWAKTAADYYGIEIKAFSGGVEVTAFNERAVAAIQRAGFKIAKKANGSNPFYFVFNEEAGDPITTFSKVYDDPANPHAGFAAVMTCSHADENCPFIPGADARLPIRYEDPKVFDDTSEEAARYDERSRQIAAEMCYVFSEIK